MKQQNFHYKRESSHSPKNAKMGTPGKVMIIIIFDSERFPVLLVIITCPIITNQLSFLCCIIFRKKQLQKKMNEILMDYDNSLVHVAQLSWISKSISRHRNSTIHTSIPCDFWLLHTCLTFGAFEIIQI